jgi:hypothetical protein
MKVSAVLEQNVYSGISRRGGAALEWQDELYVVTVELRSGVSAGSVYDLLVDLRTHLEWGGSLQPKRFQHLVAIDCPEGPAGPGTEFRSVGQTRDGRWIDHSRVTRAVRPRLFEFVTEGSLVQEGENNDLRGRWVHRYRITPEDDRCRVRYRVAQRLTHPSAEDVRLTPLAYRVMIPAFVESGVRNLLHMAETGSRSVSVLRTMAVRSTSVS